MRRLLLSAPSPYPGHLARLRLSDARIRGQLDLSEAAVQDAVRLRRCRLDDAPRLEGGQFEAVELDECRLPGLYAHSARVTQEFKVTRCTVNGTLDLRSLSVGTHLLFQDTTSAPHRGKPESMRSPSPWTSPSGRPAWTAPGRSL
ncbi:hypothetical protein ABZZ47_25645 [Streptomyces sp. NPDC006465]|uniref:hypothetical protein n=1 Tax=Streptomyces sp. NPDC006465 TaxID=3157174 RepID=UPI0033A9CC83